MEAMTLKVKVNQSEWENVYMHTWEEIRDLSRARALLTCAMVETRRTEPDAFDQVLKAAKYIDKFLNSTLETSSVENV